MIYSPLHPDSPSMPATPRRAFSLMEVLLAVFILGIGLIMVATIFPVGADWTRQSTEDSVAQTVAQNAVSTIQTYYARNSPYTNTAGKLASLTAPVEQLQALPGFDTIPKAVRTYQYGNTNPYPARKPDACVYYWTALVRVQPGQNAGASRPYDLYILVFRKGAASQVFTSFPAGSTEVPGVRDTTNTLEPTLVYRTYSAGTYDSTLTPPVANPVPPIGHIGIGKVSGTVFRQSVLNDYTTPTNTKAVARPEILQAGEEVIYAPPADQTNGSPLVYVYQTTISF
jgi:prepilin-type N-terminal cleavage/methylation domain-containing protein